MKNGARCFLPLKNPTSQNGLRNLQRINSRMIAPNKAKGAQMSPLFLFTAKKRWQNFGANALTKTQQIG